MRVVYIYMCVCVCVCLVLRSIRILRLNKIMKVISFVKGNKARFSGSKSNKHSEANRKVSKIYFTSFIFLNSNYLSIFTVN